MPGDFEALLEAFPNGFDFKKPEASNLNDGTWNDLSVLSTGSSSVHTATLPFPNPPLSPVVPHANNARAVADSDAEKRLRALTEMLAAQNSRINSLEEENKTLKTESAIPHNAPISTGASAAMVTGVEPFTNSRMRDDSIQDILADLLGQATLEKSVDPKTKSAPASTAIRGYSMQDKAQASSWKGFKGAENAYVRPATSIVASSSRAPPSTVFNRTTYAGTASPKPAKPRADSSGSSGDEYNRYVTVPERKADSRTEHRGARTQSNGSVRRGETISIHGKAARDRVEGNERGSGRAERDSSSEEEGGRAGYNNGDRASGQSRAWRSYKEPVSDDEDDEEGSEDSVDRHKELKNEWQFEDIQSPYAPPRAHSAAARRNQNENQAQAETKYGKIDYSGNYAPGWEPNVTRKENPNESREQRSLRRFQEATAALNVQDIPDYIPPRENFLPPHMRYGRHVEPDMKKPDPIHWHEDKEETPGYQQRNRGPRRPCNPASVGYYSNPAGGYRQDRPSSSNSSVADGDRPWIQPRQDDSLEQQDPWRASWENQRRGVAGRWNKRNRGL